MVVARRSNVYTCTVQGLIKEYGIVEQHESDDEDKAGPAEGTVFTQPPPGQSAPTTAEEREAAAAAAAHLAAATPEVLARIVCRVDVHIIIEQLLPTVCAADVLHICWLSA